MKTKTKEKKEVKAVTKNNEELMFGTKGTKCSWYTAKGRRIHATTATLQYALNGRKVLY